MKNPGSKALRVGRRSVPGEKYLVTKNTLGGPSDILTSGDSPQILIHWFCTAFRRRWFDLPAFVVMPDHYHLVIALGKKLSLSEVLGRINENATRRIKQDLQVKENFWQDGFHDHHIRPHEKLELFIGYVHLNPVWAGLVDQTEEWPFSSAHPDHVGKVKTRRQSGEE